MVRQRIEEMGVRKEAVDAEPEPRPLALRLEVDIGSAKRQGPGEYHLEEPRDALERLLRRRRLELGAQGLPGVVLLGQPLECFLRHLEYARFVLDRKRQFRVPGERLLEALLRYEVFRHDIPAARKLFAV